ncbi:MAG: zinc ABC transporter substrate-binding protein [Marinobacter sp.]|uniref:zinc ABC transporter substrate-binding protein n=1 Tax=Marinobacter sp. TaxID=50741 RepID=UPI00299DECF0|nr:zinc ABC transporter substrate-binding protein [Marinobacter sp.]MDX1633385.1 zinc ABC transporter substrate-binding protein [Marinobacter sp.]
MRRSRFPSLLPSAALLALLLPAGAAFAEPDVRIVTSLKPIELLVHAVATPGMTVTTLVPSGASPHTYQMRPSERQDLARADRIFWVGPGMENFLNRILTGPDFTDRAVSLAPPGLLTAHGDEEHDDEGHEDHHDEHHDDHHGHDEHHHDEHHGDHHKEEGHEEAHHEQAEDPHAHDHGHGADPHLWLDPALALIMAGQIRDSLATLPGADKAALDANLARFRDTMKAKESQIRQQLQPARDIAIFTYHDAFGRFAEHYGLSIAGVLTPTPERSPGAQHLAKVQQQLAQAGQPCLLTEPQFSRQWWRNLTEEVNLRFSTWDPLASDIEADQDGYLEFQQSLADAVLKCLPEQAQ